MLISFLAMMNFLVASDKLGNSAFTNAIIPAELVAEAGSAAPVVVYGDPAGLVTGVEAARMTHEARERGARLLNVPGGFHAKFLLWGDDDVVVTSLNWGSWTTSQDFPQGEIGVHIHRMGIARDLNERLKLLWTQL
jgi:cardiolipin synthase A/B